MVRPNPREGSDREPVREDEEPIEEPLAEFQFYVTPDAEVGVYANILSVWHTA